MPLDKVQLFKAVSPFMKVTSPVTVTESVTVAVNVTVFKTSAGDGVATTVVTVDLAVGVLTTCVIEPELERCKSSPLYVAISECDPTVSAELAMVQLPDESVQVPIVVELSVSVTAPVMVPTLVTVTFQVTDEPEILGLLEDSTFVVVAVFAVFTV